MSFLKFDYDVVIEFFNAKIKNIMTTAPFSTPISPSEIPYTNLCRQDTLLSIPKCNGRV